MMQRSGQNRTWDVYIFQFDVYILRLLEKNEFNRQIRILSLWTQQLRIKLLKKILSFGKAFVVKKHFPFQSLLPIFLNK